MFEQIPKFADDFPQGSPGGPWAGLKSGWGHQNPHLKYREKVDN